VNSYLSIPQEHKLITGGIHGDIIIWNVHHTSDVQSNNQQTLLSPIRYLTPSLSLTVGPVVLLQAIHNPITSELVSKIRDYFQNTILNDYYHHQNSRHNMQ